MVIAASASVGQPRVALASGAPRLVFLHQGECRSCWQQLGAWLLYAADGAGTRVGGLATQVPHDPAGLNAQPLVDTLFAVSPDLGRLAFVGYTYCFAQTGCLGTPSVDAYPPHLIVEDLRTGAIDDLSNLLPKSPVVFGSVESWSPDGRWIRVWGSDYSGCGGPPLAVPSGGPPPVAAPSVGMAVQVGPPSPGGTPIAGGPTRPAPASEAPAHCASGLFDVAVDGSSVRQSVWMNPWVDVGAYAPVAFTPDGRRFTFALGDILYAVPVKDDLPDLARTATRIARIHRPGATITRIAWSRDGHLALAIHYTLDDSDAYLIYVATPHGQPALAVRGAFDSVDGLAWSPDSRTLLSSGTPFFTSDTLLGTRLAQPFSPHLVTLQGSGGRRWHTRVLRLPGQNIDPQWAIVG